METASIAQNGRDLATISVELKVRTGGQIAGAVLDWDEHGIVILNQHTPHVFAWSEIDPVAALNTRRNLLAKKLGGHEKLTAEDHFQLGVLALTQGRNDLASNEFDLAKKSDRRWESRIQEAYARFRQAQSQPDEKLTAEEVPPAGPPQDGNSKFDLSPTPSGQTREAVREAYLRFGEKVREVLGPDVSLIESDHFLIWSDWGPKERNLLTQWCESMYAALCGRFGIDAKEDIFLAKCPVFSFRSKARFKKFARDFDGYDAKNAIGYTRSIEQNGHVHMAFARMGSSPADYDRFACTLVHEGTHAFLHRVYGFSLLPHWVNEGYAELTAERVLGDTCPAGENAALLAKQYDRFDWPLSGFLTRSSTIEVHEYSLAHSVVAYLDRQNPAHFAGLIRDLKKGAELSEALTSNYQGLTLTELEKAWRDSIRAGAVISRENAE